MEILWRKGSGTVKEVLLRLGRPLAYTTVMTTLDRLFKKGLLRRQKSERAFSYSPSLSRAEFDRKRVSDLVAGFLSRPSVDSHSLISCLVEAVGRQDEALLDELERKIQLKRQELVQRSKP
jgi:predicted transcriptional regulator